MNVPRRKPRTARIGIFGVGYHVYWNQFPGLLDELMSKLAILEQRVTATGVTVFNFGMVDKAQDAYALLPKLKAADLDLVFCDMLTYATSASFGAIVRALDIPIVLVALQPLSAMDYPRATTHMQLANDDFCSVPEFLGVAIRMGKRPPEVILGTLDNDPQAEADLPAVALVRDQLAVDVPGRGLAADHGAGAQHQRAEPHGRARPDREAVARAGADADAVEADDLG